MNLQYGLYYDVAIVDRSLPFVDGDVVIEKLKEKYPQKPVICTSAYGTMVAKADAHLYKPFSLDSLEALVNRMLKATSQ